MARTFLTMTDHELEWVSMQASASWFILQEWIWGVRWDYGQPSLDFSRASLRTLSIWLARAREERSTDEFEQIAVAASLYFGATVGEHVHASWAIGDEDRLELHVDRPGHEAFIVDVGKVLANWRSLMDGQSGSEREAFVDQFDAVLAASKPA